MKQFYATILCLLSLTACEGPEPAPAINAKAGDILQTSESGGTATFTLTLNSEPKSNVSINIHSNDTTEGTVTPGSVVFTPSNWKSPKTVTLTGQDDTLIDGDIPYVIIIEAAKSSDSKYNGLDPADIPAINLDDDDPNNPPSKSASITVTPQQIQTSENGQSAQITVALSQAPAADTEVNVNVVSDNENEGRVDAGNGLTFTASDWADKTVTVTGQDDSASDGNITYHINFTVSESTASGHLPLDPEFAAVTIAPVTAINIDNEQSPAAAIMVEPNSGLQTSENGDRVTIAIHLASQPSDSVTLNFSSSNPAEGIVSPQQLSFNADNFALAQTLTIIGKNDAIVDGDQAYVIDIDPSASADPSYAVLGLTSLPVINLDNDPEPNPGISVSLVDANSDESGGSGQISLVLDAVPEQAVTLTLTSSNSGEGIALPNSISFDDSNWRDTQFVSIVGQDDDVVDGAVSYDIMISSSSGDSRYNNLNLAAQTLVNADNEIPSLVVTPVGGITTSESGTSADIMIALGAKPLANDSVVVSATLGNPAEGSIAPVSLSFDQSNWNTAQAFTVTGKSDNVVDGDISYNVSFSVVAGTSNPYNALVIDPYPVTNLDTTITATPGVFINAANPVITSESGSSATFTVVLQSQPNAAVTINANTSNPAEGLVSPTSFQFTNDSGGLTSWNTPQTFTITGQDDTLVDGDISYQITFSATSSDTNYNGINISAVNAVNQDNDSVLPTVQVSAVSAGSATNESGTSVEFDVSLSAAPSGSVTISAVSDNLAEGQVTSGDLQFDSSNFGTPQRVVVTGQDDSIVDGDVSYHIDFTVTGAANTTVAQQTVVNGDNEIAAIVVTPETGLQTSESGASTSVNVTLAAAPAPNTTVNVSATSQNANEGLVDAPGMVSFTDADWNIAKTISITGQDDTIIDGDVVYSVNLAISATPSSNPYNSASHAPLQITNLDNDGATPNVIVTAATPLQTSETGTSATFTVVLDAAPSSVVTVAASSGNPAEATISPASVSFTSGVNSNWQTPQTFTVTGQDDAQADGDITYSISFNVSGAQTPAAINAINLDNEQAALSIATVATQTSEAGDAISIAVKLAAQPALGSIITVNASSDNIAEGSVTPNSLSFNDSDWNLEKSLSVSGVNDNIADGDVNYAIQFSVSGDTSNNPYTGISVAPLALTNVDNDYIQVSAVSGQVSDASGQSVTLMVNLLQTPPADIAVKAASSDIGAAKTYPRDSLSDQPLDLLFSPTSALDVAQVIRVVGQAPAPAAPIDYQVNFSISSNSAIDSPVQVPASLSFQHVASAPPTPSGDATISRYIEPSGNSDTDPNNPKFKIMANDGTLVEATGVESFTDSLGFTDQISGTPLVVSEGQTVHWQLYNDHIDPHPIMIYRFFQDTLQGGENGYYHFAAPSAGTYLIGSNNAAEQSIGLVSVLIVTPTQANSAWSGGPTFDQEYTWLITDMDSTWINLKVNASDPSPVPNANFSPDVQLVNGRNYTARTDANGTRLIASSGQILLLRVLNGGSVVNTIVFPNAGNSGVQEISRNGVHAANIATQPMIDSVDINPNETVMLLYTVPTLAPGMHDILLQNSIINSGSNYAYDRISVLELL